MAASDSTARSATTLMMRLAGAVDREEQAFKRLAIAAGKYWVTKRGPVFAGEALECLGGNGYVEDSGLPLRYREAPLNSVWEGSGNVNALDVLRALSREPEALDAWLIEVGRARGEDRRLDRAIEDVLEMLADTTTLEVSARLLAGRMAACLQGSLLVRFAPSAVADAFCATRLGTDYGGTLGTLPAGTDLGAIVERATPGVSGSEATSEMCEELLDTLGIPPRLTFGPQPRAADTTSRASSWTCCRWSPPRNDSA